MSLCDLIYTVHIRCPDFGSTSNIAASIVEDELITVLNEYNDIASEGVPCGWMNESYETQVRAQLFDEQGKVRITGGEAEFLCATDKPKKTVRFYANEAKSLMESIMDNNHDVLLDVSSNYIIESAVVARKFPGMWVVQITGAQL